MIWQNIEKISKHTWARITMIVSFFCISYLWYIYSDVEYVIANYRSYIFAYFDTLLSWCVILLFPLLLGGIVYKSMVFGRRAHHTKKHTLLGPISGIISVFITGASCCGITLISVLGLSSVIGFLEIFPYHGLEIKTLSVLILLYAVGDMLKNLESCKR